MKFCGIARRDMYIQYTQVLIDDGGMMHGFLADLELGEGTGAQNQQADAQDRDSMKVQDHGLIREVVRK